MKALKNVKRCMLGCAVAAVLLLGAGASHAQTNYFPNGQPYACTYQLLNGNTGVAIVTFSLGPGTLQRSGTLTNLYANGSSTARAVTITADVLLGGFLFHQTQDNIQCHLETYSAGRHVVFTQCTNGNRQECRQWW